MLNYKQIKFKVLVEKASFNEMPCVFDHEWEYDVWRSICQKDFAKDVFEKFQKFLKTFSDIFETEVGMIMSAEYKQYAIYYNRGKPVASNDWYMFEVIVNDNLVETFKESLNQESELAELIEEL